MATATTPGEQLARLHALVGEAGHNYYERIALAAALLGNQGWLDSSYQGDAYRAAEMLETKYFHDLCGAMSVWDFLRIYQFFPRENDWQAHGYNLRAMHDKCKAKPENSQPREVVRVKRAEFEAAQTKVQELTATLKTREKEVKSKDGEVMRLRERVTELEHENLKLSGRVDELEKLLSKKFMRATG